MRSWGYSEDGSLEYLSYQPKDHYDGVFEALEKSFYGHETVCEAIGVSSDPKAVEELNELIKHSLKDGVSIVAVEKLTGRVVGAVINKIQVNTVEQEPFFENFAKSCKSSKSKEVIIYMQEADDTFNLFEYCKVDCLLELTFFVVVPDYRNKKVGETLTKKTIELAKKLSEGENVKVPIDDKELSLEPVPKIVAALFTSVRSQRVGEKCGFEVASTISHKDLYLSGKAWAGRTNENSPTSLLVFKRF